jgi:hypothetical protein
MIRTSRRPFALLAGTFVPVLLLAQTEPETTESAPPAAAAETVAAAVPGQQTAVRYEPANPVQLPIQTCEIQALAVPRPYQVTLPARVRISLFDLQELKKLATFFDGELREPMKLDPGFYMIEVEGHEEPIYLGYGYDEALPMYLVHRQPGDVLIGPFIIPGIGRVPTGQYTVRGTGFAFPIECRYNERAVFEVPIYEELPPFVEPGPGRAW